MQQVKTSNIQQIPKPRMTVVKPGLEELFRELTRSNESAELFQARKKIEQAYREISIINKDLTDSINYARRIQHAILPDTEILTTHFEQSFVLYKPKSIVSGDFYWFTKYEDKLLVAAVDCTGHGVPGAFMSMIGHNLLNEIVNVKDITRPSEILNRLDRSLRILLKQDREHTGARDGMDVSICFIDPANGQMEFAGANHLVFLLQEGILQTIKGDKFPVGGIFRQDEIRYTNHSVPVSKGDVIYLFTDGYADQFGGSCNKKMMTKRFKQILKLVYPMKASQQKKVITSFFEEWKGENEQTDDVLVIGIKI